MSKPVELLQDNDGKLSRTGVMFLVWMVFFMTLIGYTTYHLKDRLADIPEAYVYVTLVLCGTYTARRFLDNKFGTAGQSQAINPPDTTPKA